MHVTRAYLNIKGQLRENEGMRHIILMVEDSDDDALIIRKKLEEHVREPFSLARHETLREACLFIDEQRDEIRLVLLDLGLPDTDGMEDTFARMREHCAGIPVVVLTGADDHDLAVKLVGGGAENFINKDMVIDRPELLRDAVDFAVSRHNLMAEEQKKNSEKLAEKDMVISWMAGDYSLPGQAQEAVGDKAKRT